VGVRRDGRLRIGGTLTQKLGRKILHIGLALDGDRRRGV